MYLCFAYMYMLNKFYGFVLAVNFTVKGSNKFSSDVRTLFYINKVLSSCVNFLVSPVSCHQVPSHNMNSLHEYT